MKTHGLSKKALLLSSLVLATAASSPVLADETVATDASTPVSSIFDKPTSDTNSNAASTNPTTDSSATTTAAEASNSNTATASTESNAAAATTSTENKDTAPKEGEKVNVRILGTTDLHTNLVNYDYYQDKPSEQLGLAKTAVLIEEAKKENPNVLLVDNGDTIQGTPLGTYKAIVQPIKDGETHPMYEALHALGFEAGTLGNHEFNYGLDYLRKVIAGAKMPIVNANVRDAKTGDFAYTPYIILPKTFNDTEGRPVTVNIGITGIVPPQILNWDKANLEGKITVDDSVEAVTAIVPKMRQAGADIVLVLSHSGIGDDKYEKGEENEGYQIAGIQGVDAVVTGHSHAEFPSGTGLGFYEKYKGVDGINGKINGTPVTMAGKYGDHLGIIDLNLVYTDGKWKVEDSKGFIRKVDTKSPVADARILEIAKKAHEGTIAYVRQQVGTTTAPITSYFALVKDDPSIQIVNKAQLWYAKQELAGTPEGKLPILSAAAPFKAGTRGDATAYTDIPAGPIAIKNVADLYLYDNVTAILKVNGAQIKEWLEMSAGQFNQIDPTKTDVQDIVDPQYRTYNFDVIDGITYQFDITQPKKYDRNGKLLDATANRVKNLQYQGKDIDPNQEFIVVTNNYRANGTFPGVKDASLNRLLNLENRQAIINYIVAEKTINPTADNNWSFTDSIKGLNLRFLTADKAKDLVASDTILQYVGPSASSEGFGEFKYVWAEIKPETPSVTPEDPSDKPVNPTEVPSETIVLPDSKQVITLPTASKTADRAVRANVPFADEHKANERRLPETGEHTSLLNLLGLALMSGLTAFGFRRNQQ